MKKKEVQMGIIQTFNKRAKRIIKGRKNMNKKGECEENLGTGRGEELVIELVKLNKIYEMGKW